jgi:hypothetical protein
MKCLKCLIFSKWAILGYGNCLAKECEINWIIAATMSPYLMPFCSKPFAKSLFPSVGLRIFQLCWQWNLKLIFAGVCHSLICQHNLGNKHLNPLRHTFASLLMRQSSRKLISPITSLHTNLLIWSNITNGFQLFGKLTWH